MDIEVGPEGIDEARISGEMRQDPQLDLRIVSDEESRTFISDESLANGPSLFAPHRDVLQIGLFL